MSDDALLLESKIYRRICAQRKRLLRKRGEFVKWSAELKCWVWRAPFHLYDKKIGLPIAEIPDVMGLGGKICDGY